MAHRGSCRHYMHSILISDRWERLKVIILYNILLARQHHPLSNNSAPALQINLYNVVMECHKEREGMFRSCLETVLDNSSLEGSQ